MERILDNLIEATMGEYDSSLNAPVDRECLPSQKDKQKILYKSYPNLQNWSISTLELQPRSLQF